MFQRLDTLCPRGRASQRWGEDHTHTSAHKGVSPGSSQMHDAFNEELSDGRLTMTKVSRSIHPQKTGRRAGCIREQRTPSSPSMTRLPTVKSGIVLALSNGRLTMTRVSRSIRPQKTGRRAGCTREQRTPSPSMTRLPTVKSALFLPHTRAAHRVSPLAFLCAHERVVLVVAATAPFFGCSSCQNCRCRTECTGIAFNSR